jgi:hypothetical protein
MDYAYFQNNISYSETEIIKKTSLPFMDVVKGDENKKSLTHETAYNGGEWLTTCYVVLWLYH